MMIEFQALGIAWEADVDYTPPGPPAERYDLQPPDPEECLIVSLWNDHTKNAVWLLDSTVAPYILEAATEAAGKAYRNGRGLFDEP